MRDAPTKLVKEESARSMGHSKLAKLAATKDVQIMPEMEESVGGMEQNKHPKSAVMKDAPTMLR